MAVLILTCECGLRVKAAGAVPGRIGRCPNCGARLLIPEAVVPDRPRGDQEANLGEAAEAGYALEPGGNRAHLSSGQLRTRSLDRLRVRCRSRAGSHGRRVLACTRSARNLLVREPALPTPRCRVPGSDRDHKHDPLALSHARSGIPPILINDAESMGTPTIGHFIALLSILPFVLLLPLVVFYWLQYLGRTLVSSAMGETAPPRSPDRNFDGFLSGLSPWLVWLCLGVVVGLSPLAAYASTLTSPAECRIPIALGLAAIGFPYILMALMMAFVHDNALAANPLAVLGTLARLAGSFGFLSLFLAALLALGLSTFAVALALRTSIYWLYIPVCLGCWIVEQWAVIVVVRILGLYYYYHKDILKWHSARPRWGVAWRL